MNHSRICGETAAPFCNIPVQIIFGISLAAFLCFAGAERNFAAADSNAESKAERSAAIRVALYNGGGSSRGGITNVFKILDKTENMKVTLVEPEEIRGGVLTNYDVVIFTGGSGSKQAAALGEEARGEVKKFVENGGGYIGICAGAYLATSGYDWSLKVIDSKTISPKWQRGKGTVKMELTDEGRKIFGDTAGEIEVRYANGPVVCEANTKLLPGYTPLAFFRSELAKNGTPEGIMINSPAILSGTCSKGRVITISPHPEATSGLGYFIPKSVEWVSGKKAKVVASRKDS